MEKIDIGGGIAEIATKEEALWIRMKENAEARIKQAKESLVVDEAFLEMCNEKLKAFNK